MKNLQNNISATQHILIAVMTGLLFCYVPTARADNLELGLVGPFTGPYAAFGEQMKRGAEQAVADINAKGGINGQKVELKASDDACDPKQAVAIANQFASEKIKFVVGHYCSGTAIPASKVYMEEQMLLISPAATNPKLTDEANTYIFRVCGRDDRQSDVIAGYVLRHFKEKKIAIIHDKSAYGFGLADGVRQNLNKAGMKEVLFEAYTAGERDYSALVSKLKAAGADLVVVGGYHTETGLIVRQMRAQQLMAQVMGGDALVTDELWSITGKAGEGILMTFGPDPRSNLAAMNVVTALRKKKYEPEGYTLYTYAAFQVLAGALAQAKSAEPVKVAAALRGATFNSALGPLSFDAKGDVKGTGYVVYQWHDGTYAEIKK